MNGLRRIYGPAMLAGVVLSVAGCGVAPKTALTPEGKAVLHAQGRVHGGQQPVSGSTVQVWAAGTGGDGSSATQETASVLTDQNGGFTLPDTLSCSGTSGSTMLYLTATGGQPLTGVTNNNLAMMTAFGACGNWNVNSFISINEVTTVGAVSALSGYMTGPTAVGSGSSDAAALASAFATAEEYVDSASGASPGNGVSSGYSVPTTTINTLADALSACINSAGGSASDGGTTSCGLLFGYTTPSGGSAPTDTITAMLNLALYPTLNTTGVFNLVPSQSPFQPTMTSPPPDFRVRFTPSTFGGYVLQAAPLSVSFPDTVTSTTSATQMVLLNNQGTTTLTLSTPVITGTNLHDFTESTTCGSSLASATTCTISVAAKPSATGSRTAYLEVISSSPDSPQYIALNVNGITASTAPRLKVESSASFASGAANAIVVTNTGGSTLVISSASTFTPHFSTVNGCASVAPNGTCKITVSNVGGAVDLLTITSNDPASPTYVSLAANSNTNVTASQLYFAPGTVGSAGTTSPLTYTYSAFTGVNPTESTCSPTIDGANPGDFVLSTGATYATDCSVTVAFKPAATGLRTATLELGGSIPLSGMGFANASAQNLSFDVATAGFYNNASGNLTRKLNNTTGNVATISSITLPASFSQTNDCGGVVASQSYCTFTLSASQQYYGGIQGPLTVVTSQGTAYEALSAAMDYTLPFGSALAGTIATTSYGVGTISPGSLNATVSAPFTGSINCTPSRNANSCSTTMQFQPTSGGNFLGTATVSASNLPYRNYTLSGTGVPLASGPALSELVSQPLRKLPDQNQVVYAGSAYTVMGSLVNNGPVALNLAGSPTFSGTQASEFTATTNCGVLASLANCSPGVAITPVAPGLRSATATFIDSTSGTSFIFPLQIVVAPALGVPALSPNSLTFPPTPYNQESEPQSITVTTPAGDPITATSYPASVFVLTKNSCAQGENPCLLTMVFRPVSGSSMSGSLTVQDTNSTYTATIELEGSLAGATPTATVSPTSLSFSQAVGTLSGVSPINVTNTGMALVTLAAGITITGPNAAEFTLPNTCSGATIYVGSSCGFGVRFAPQTAGQKTATLIIPSTTTASGLPVTVQLSGNAY